MSSQVAAEISAKLHGCRSVGVWAPGPIGDLVMATKTARGMVCDWGMSKSLGPQSFSDNQELMFLGREVTRTQNYSEETARRIDSEVSQMLKDSYDRATTLISENRAMLDMIAERLLERETIDGRDVKELVEEGRILTEGERDVIDKEEERKEKAEELANGTAAPVPAPQPAPVPDAPEQSPSEETSPDSDA